MKKPSMISILLFLTGLLCIIALIFFNRTTLHRILTTEKEVDTISEQITAKHDEVKQAVDKYTTAIDTVQSNINRMKQKQQTATQKKSKAAKELILRDQPGNNNAPLANAVQERMQGDKKIRIVFSENSAFEPVIANMILQFKTPVNILRADTKNVGGVAKGEMILGLPEDRHLQVDIEEYLKEKGLAVEEVTEDVE